jgi:hypothetical protein
VIPVVPQPEPEDFDERVRKKGKKFLRKIKIEQRDLCKRPLSMAEAVLFRRN